MSDLSKSNTLGSKFSLAMVPLYLILRFVIHLVFTELNVNIKKNMWILHRQRIPFYTFPRWLPR